MFFACIPTLGHPCAVPLTRRFLFRGFPDVPDQDPHLDYVTTERRHEWHGHTIAPANGRRSISEKGTSTNEKQVGGQVISYWAVSSA